MSLHETFGQPLLTFPDAEKSPLSIRAKALVFVDPRSRQLREDLQSLAPRALPVLIRGETGSGKSPISSRYKVPPLAEPNQPARLLAAPLWLPAA